MYRFRKIEHLLDKRRELENQEIYFSPPEDLNDPMEGYKDVFWKGDAIVWRNFIINYVRSVEYTFMVALLYQDKILTAEDILVTPNPEAYKAVGMKVFLQQILDDLFSYEFIKTFPNALAERSSIIRREELISYLEFIHPFVIKSVSKIYADKKFLAKTLVTKDLLDLSKLGTESKKLVNLINKLEKESKHIPNAVDKFFLVSNMTSQQIRLINRYNNEGKNFQPNTFFLISEYPTKFITAIETIIFPEWYSASFILDCQNSAVWGHYGDNHKGVCLKFKATNQEDKLIINLETEYGYNSAPVIDMRPHTFKKIHYQNKHVEIDFFRSLGRQSKLLLMELWYKDSESGNISECASHLSGNRDEWRNNHWDNFDKSVTVKLDDWGDEKEYRLIIYGGFIDYSKPEKRKLKYDFNDLESVTFGIKTTDEDKTKIMRIIEKKCRENNRKEFGFYQAYYSMEDGEIKTYKLNLLKFD